MNSARINVGSGSPLEPEIGFSRAVRKGAHVAVAGTAPIADGGGTAGVGDVYAQTVRCLDIAEAALAEAGASLDDVVRTRVMLTDVTRWKEAARAHGERFASVRPVTTFVEVSRFIDPEWLVEIEVDAMVDAVVEP
ncbi:RidA family protein [Streptomyces sp. SKN60]|uniref:RidA family protein n=1 Tax=Streptomyces sp. SKN60 TaxID=2855506 RepID=UPI00224793A6|nr:RidA family protein [Streptomyces sp. SKN60]MCX2180884.1 RidA family protein [Streptomyces sp. SKN60]